MNIFLYVGLAVFLACSECLAGSAGQQDEYEGIVAIVNDNIITHKDLEERLELMLLAIGKDGADAGLREQIRKEVLKEMILERLKWTCVQKYAPKGGFVTEKEVEEAFKDVAGRNGKNTDDFTALLSKKGIGKEVLQKHLRIMLSWIAYINLRFGRFVNISEAEMRRTMAQLKERESKELYYVYRMFFPVSDSRDEQAVLAQTNNILQMLAKGVSFSNLARQFSQGPGASKGGEIGWVFQGQLSPEEGEALHRMLIGGHEVVRTSRGYSILHLQNRRSAGAAMTYTTLTLVQVITPIQDPSLPKEAFDQVISSVRAIKQASKGCRDFLQRAADSGFCMIAPPQSTTLEDIAPNIRTMLENIDAGGISNPIMMPGGILTLCVLDKKVNKIPEPTREEILAQKRNEKLSVFADRDLRNLKNKADIDAKGAYSWVLQAL
ncbi:MAG: peptidylprolyl isomerase [Holosporaceae bacterium]|nr:peptidylprolyl isomerase [Holosporaceae bacterium]